MAAFLALFEGATENEKATPSRFFVALSLRDSATAGKRDEAKRNRAFLVAQNITCAHGCLFGVI